MPFVDRDPGTGWVRNVWRARQWSGQEELADGHPDLAARDLRRAREGRCDEVDALHQRHERRGFVYQGVRYQLDAASQSKIGDMALRASLALIQVPGVDWVPLEFVAADNSVTTFTDPADFLAMAVAAANTAQALFAHRTGLKQACRAAANAEDLAAIDITAGWPA